MQEHVVIGKKKGGSSYRGGEMLRPIGLPNGAADGGTCTDVDNQAGRKGEDKGRGSSINTEGGGHLDENPAGE